MKNWAREELGAEISASLKWNIKHDKLAVVIELIKLINAVWLASLWHIGFALGLPLVLWFFFFPASVAIAFYIEKRRSQRQEKPSGTTT